MRFEVICQYAERKTVIDVFDSGYVQQVPQVSIAQQNLRIMQSFCSEFGLTPATRSRIIAGGSEPAADDPMEALIAGQWG